MKQFTQEFTIYQMINQDSPTMWNVYTCTALFLSFMRGPAINDWALQQTEGLYTKCNGDPLNGIAPMYQMDDEQIWVEFSHEFRHAFADTASEQCAYGELASYTMGGSTIDEYVAHFKHLLQKAG
jgi:hypothetical protein